MKTITVERARELVKLWTGYFRAIPPSVCLTLMEVESSFRPEAHAVPPPEAIERGADPRGAFGLLQVLPDTAADVVRSIQAAIAGDVARKADGEAPLVPQDVIDCLTVWDREHPECLLREDLGSLIGVAYLDHIAKRFGSGLEKIAGAYHNGPAFMQRFLEQGKAIPDDMPPKGKAYIIRACELWRKYADADPIHTPDAPPATS